MDAVGVGAPPAAAGLSGAYLAGPLPPVFSSPSPSRPKSKSGSRNRRRDRKSGGGSARRDRPPGSIGASQSSRPVVPGASKKPRTDYMWPGDVGQPEAPAKMPHALVANADYQLVLSALNVLRGQKMQAERDLAKLEAQREAALSDPSRFIAALMTRTNEPLPKRQKVVRIPIVPLERYGIKPEEIGIEPSAPPATTGQPTPFRATPYVEEAIKAIQPPQSPDGRTLWMPKGLGTFDRLAGTAFRNSLPPRADSPALSDSPVSVVPKHPIAPILEPAPPPRLPNQSRTSGAIYEQKYQNALHLSAQRMAVPSPVPLVGTPEPDAETASNANGTGSTTDIAESPSNATPVPTSSAATTPQTQPADTPEAREEKQPADDKLDVKPDPQFVQSQILVQELELQSQSQSELQLEIQPKADGKPVPPLPQAQNHPRIAAMPPAPPSKPAPSIQAQKARERRRKKALAKAEAAAATAVHPQYCDACGMDPIIGIRFACIECAALEIFVDLCSGCAAKGFTNDDHPISHTLRKVLVPEPPHPPDPESMEVDVA